MEIAKGYKQTEVGVIPEDWDTPQIEALTSIATGSTPPTSNTSNYGDQYMFAGPADIGGKKYIHNTVKKLSTRGFKISRKFPKGSTLFVCIGSTIGKCAIATTKLTSNQQINAVFPCDHLDSEYVYYALCSRSLSIKALAGEQAVPLVNKTQFGETLIPLPPTKAEQEAIAEALSDADSLIESLQQLIAKKRQIKQGAMQELLRPKDDWVEKTLGEMGKCHRGVSYNPNTDLRDGDSSSTCRLFRSNNIQRAKIALADTHIVAGHRVSESQTLKLGDIVICMANGSKRLVGKAASFDIEDGYTYTFGAFMGAFRPIQTEGCELVFHLFQTNKFRNHIGVILAGSSINNLKPSDIEEFCISLPKPTEQTRIATILSDMDEEITALETKLNKARQLKQGMMHNLLTGKIRLV